MSEVFDLAGDAPTRRRALVTPGRRYVNEDVTPELREEAERWLTDYEGDNQFLSDVRDSMEVYNHVTIPQARGILNFMSAEIRQQQRDTEPRGDRHDEVTSIASAARGVAPARFEEFRRPPPMKVPDEGTYTIIWPDNSHTTLRVVGPNHEKYSYMRLEQNAVVVEYLNGPDNEDDYVGFAFIKPTGAYPWKRYRKETKICTALQRLMASPEDAGYAYALKSGKCYRCHRKLTVPASLHRGLGPICATRV